MRLSSGGLERPGRGAAAAAAVVLCWTLAGCTPTTTVDGTPSPSSSIYVPSATPTASGTPTGAPRETAVVSVAGADVDGLHVSFAGLVTSVAEDGGSCEFDATSAAGVVVKASSVGTANGSTTSCPFVQLPIAQFTRGSWSVVLRYHSAQTDSVSAPAKMEIP